MKTFEERSPRFRLWSNRIGMVIGLASAVIIGLAFVGLVVSGLVAIGRRAF